MEWGKPSPGDGQWSERWRVVYKTQVDIRAAISDNLHGESLRLATKQK